VVDVAGQSPGRRGRAVDSQIHGAFSVVIKRASIVVLALAGLPGLADRLALLFAVLAKMSARGGWYFVPNGQGSHCVVCGTRPA
jgi:hypothetical protein